MGVAEGFLQHVFSMVAAAYHAQRQAIESGRRGVVKLAQGVLGGDVPKGLVEKLLAASGGNPFFAEELVQAFIDTGALSTSPDRGGWIWDEAKATRAGAKTTERIRPTAKPTQATRRAAAAAREEREAVTL